MAMTKRKPATEGFYLDDKGKRQDRQFHEDMGVFEDNPEVPDVDHTEAFKLFCEREGLDPKE